MAKSEFEIGQSYATTRHASGAPALTSGWSNAEKDHTWSYDNQATLVFPLRRDQGEPAKLQVRLQGWVIEGPWTARFLVNGKIAKKVIKQAGDDRGLNITIPLTNLARDALAIKIDCVFENIYCPFADTGLGDRRKLSLALQSFTIETLGSDGSNKASVTALRQVLAQRPHRLTAIVVEEDLEAGIEVSKILETAGLGGLTLICHQSSDSTLAEFDLSAEVEVHERDFDKVRPFERAGYRGPIAQFLARVAQSQLHLDLIVLPDSVALSSLFSELVDALSQSSRPRGAAPDIILFTRELGFWERASHRNPLAYSKVIFPLTAVAWPDFVHLSRQRSEGGKSSYGTMVALIDDTEVRFSIEGFSTPNARTGPTVALFRSILARGGIAPKGKPRRLNIQYDDISNEDVSSVAYCRKRGASPSVRLIPDTYFFQSRGYQKIRDAFSQGDLPRWEDRKPLVFWRGSATTNFTAPDRSRVERIEQVPRIAMCLALKDVAKTDAAIMDPWQLSGHLRLEPADVIDRLKQHKIFRPGVPMIEHADYRFLIDIDGVGNAWSFFEKLLLGSCVLKVSSPFEQWFYSEIAAWRHYVPVSQDLSDLTEKLDWSLQHEEETRSIAERGQKFAINHTYETGLEIAVTAAHESIV